MGAFVERTINSLRERIGEKKVLLALSGGVDSSVLAALLSRAVGKQLTCVFVDHGFLRKNEGDEVEAVFGPSGSFDLNFIRVDAKERFLRDLSGVTEPEQKRKIIGRDFIEVFEEEAKKIGTVDFFAQGTIYPDVHLTENLLNPNKPIEISLYQPEERVCNLIFPILEKLELMNDMEVYYEIDDILSNEPLDGLKLFKTFEREVEKRDISLPRLLDRVSKFAKYENNTFLRKKWKAYLRVNRYEKKEWKLVQKETLAFIEPLVKAMENNSVFIDSWLPELGRYLG
jgi:hypothetical protein